MKTSVNLKYSIGDYVNVEYDRYHHAIPETVVYKVDGFIITLKLGSNCEVIPIIEYVFHARYDKYIDYHERVPEERIKPVKTHREWVIDIDTHDVFGEAINFGDQVYCNVYTVPYGEKEPKCSSSFSLIYGGEVIEFEYDNTDGYRGVYVKFNNNMAFHYANGDLCGDAKALGTSKREHVSVIAKTIPDSYPTDFISKQDKIFLNAFMNYDHHVFTDVMSEFGMLEKAELELRKAINENNKSKKEKKTIIKKDTSELEEILNKINLLSVKEKKELIKKINENLS